MRPADDPMFFNESEEEQIQYVSHPDFTDEQLAEMTPENLKKIKGKWKVRKMYHNYNLGNDLFEFDPSRPYKGFITDYTIYKKRNTNNKEYYCIKFYVTVHLEEDGSIYELTHYVNANFLNRTPLTKLLFELGFNVGNVNDFELDWLINLPVLVYINRLDNGYVCIQNMCYRRV